MKQIQIGLKLWSTNDNYLKPAKDLFDQGVFDYIELYFVPGTLNTYKLWNSLDIPVAVHAPHERHGLNLSLKANLSHNQELLKETLMFANKTQSNYIVVHPGYGGNVDEVVNQLFPFKNEKICIENMPLKLLNTSDVSVGATYEDLVKIINKLGISFCLDINHSICTANALSFDLYSFIQQLSKLEPIFVHISDNAKSEVIDTHLHLGKGDHDFNKIFKIISCDQVLIETNKDSPDNLLDFNEDVNYLKMILGSL